MSPHRSCATDGSVTSRLCANWLSIAFNCLNTLWALWLSIYVVGVVVLVLRSVPPVVTRDLALVYALVMTLHAFQIRALVIFDTCRSPLLFTLLPLSPAPRSTLLRADWWFISYHLRTSLWSAIGPPCPKCDLTVPLPRAFIAPSCCITPLYDLLAVIRSFRLLITSPVSSLSLALVTGIASVANPGSHLVHGLYRPFPSVNCPRDSHAFA